MAYVTPNSLNVRTSTFGQNHAYCIQNFAVILAPAILSQYTRVQHIMTMQNSHVFLLLILRWLINSICLIHWCISRQCSIHQTTKSAAATQLSTHINISTCVQNTSFQYFIRLNSPIRLNAQLWCSRFELPPSRLTCINRNFVQSRVAVQSDVYCSVACQKQTDDDAWF